MRVGFIRSMLLAVGMLFLSSGSFAQVGVSITIAPPELPVYEQPICPGDGYIWTPGYWAWADGDYYWVPGTWVQAPEVGFLWTPGYWRWGGNAYIFDDGYWGPSVGFYGGVDYGFGYFGHGYEGGRWTNGHFFYNTTVNNVNVGVIHNVYNTRLNEGAVNRVSFNGGTGGINVRATAQEEAAARDRHVPPVAAQTQHAQAARSAPEQRFAANHGAPAVAATPQPGAFKDRAVVPAKPAAASNNTASRAGNNPSAPVHPKELPAVAAPAPPKTGRPEAGPSTSSSKSSWRHRRTRSGRPSSRSRIRNTSSWRNSRLIKRERSKSSSSISNRRSSYSKSTRSRRSRCNSGNSRQRRVAVQHHLAKAGGLN